MARKQAQEALQESGVSYRLKYHQFSRSSVWQSTILDTHPTRRQDHHLIQLPRMNLRPECDTVTQKS
jgi:hypothetical protein